MKEKLLVLIMLLGMTLPVNAVPEGGYNLDYTRVYGWKTTKKHLKKFILRRPHPRALYSNCPITPDFKVDVSHCGWYFRYYNGQDGDTISIDMEHIVPASRMMVYTGCAEMESRSHCRKRNKRFKQCHNDPRNLYPAISTINRFRSALPFRHIPRGKGWYPFGKTIGFKKSLDGQSVEPPNFAKKTVGYAYLMMYKMECINLSDDEFELYKTWYYTGNNNYEISETF